MHWSDITGILGIYGAGLSTTLGAIKVAEFRRDRARIKVVFDPYVISTPEGTAREYSAIRVVNEGRRPVTINAVGLELTDERKFLPPLGLCLPRLPVMLEEAKDLCAFIPREQLQLRQVRGAFAQTTDGRVYRTKQYKHRESPGELRESAAY